MAENSKIEWTDHTFNPWTGCTKVSPGCDGCYAEAWAKRSGTVRWGAGEPRRRTTAANWQLPHRWNAQAAREGRRYRVFCASLADVFDNQVPEPWRWELFRLIAATPHLDWLLLTKRIGNAHDMLNDAAAAVAGEFVGAKEWDRAPWPNVWLGATVVNQVEANRDVPKLLVTPARVRFLSIEPMLGPIDLTRIVVHRGPIELLPTAPPSHYAPHVCITVNALKGSTQLLHWVIAGGESGPHARPAHPDWFRKLRLQCAAAGVPFLFKQWGEWLPATEGRSITGRVLVVEGEAPVPKAPQWHHFPDGGQMARVGKKAAGRRLDGVEHNGVPHG